MNPFYSEMASLAAAAKGLHARGFLDAADDQPGSFAPQDSGDVSSDMVDALEGLKQRFAPQKQAVAQVKQALPRIDPAILERLGSLDPLSALAVVQTEVMKCRTCSLGGEGPHAVAGEGLPGALVMVVADIPSRTDSMEGQAFRDEAGAFLDKWLDAIGLKRGSSAWVGHLVKCWSARGAEAYPQAVPTCQDWFQVQARIIKPRAILSLGAHAGSWFAGRKVQFPQDHGQVLAWQGIPVMCTWHPSEVLAKEDLKRPVWQDLKTFKARFLGDDGIA